MKFRKKPVVIEAAQWFKNGDHPLDYSRTHGRMENREPHQSSPEERKANNWEGDVVRYYRHPEVSGETTCKYCDKTLHKHGWIDTLEGGHIVCPGDWIITGVAGEMYPCKPDIFAATYEPAMQEEPVGWQFYQDGKWWHGDDRIKDHRKNTEEARYPIRDVYATPQPAEQKPDTSGLTEALRQYRHNDGSGLVFGYDKLLVDQYVAGLVEALEICLEMEERPNIIKMARAALAAYRKGDRPMASKYKLVPVEPINRAIDALERFANDSLAGRNSAQELREAMERHGCDEVGSC